MSESLHRIIYKSQVILKTSLHMLWHELWIRFLIGLLPGALSHLTLDKESRPVRISRRNQWSYAGEQVPCIIRACASPLSPGLSLKRVLGFNSSPCDNLCGYVSRKFSLINLASLTNNSFGQSLFCINRFRICKFWEVFSCRVWEL